jgi:hypothetical protein
MTIPNLSRARNCLFYASLDLLFQSLSIERVLQVFSLFLLERQMVFVSADSHRLTLAMLCLRGLAMPFRYRGSFLPVLPDRDEYSDLLDAPTPYAIGVLNSNTKVRIPSHACVIDLDAGTVADPDHGPLVPGAKMAIRTLKKLIQATILLPQPGWHGAKEMGEVNTRYCQAVREHKAEFASLHSYWRCPRKRLFTEAHTDEIVAVFAELLAPPLEAIASICFVTDCTDRHRPVTVLNRELFRQTIKENESAFYEAFTQTTMFQEFIDRKMDEKSREIAALIIPCE